jgi:hypothetical protein
MILASRFPWLEMSSLNLRIQFIKKETTHKTF